jgi:uncharacterized protein YbjT (DUF2867 family)
MNDTPRVLVTGATGTIGGALVRELVARGVSVRALSRRPDEARLPSSVDVVYGDLTMPESLDAGLNSMDVVFLVWTAPPESLDAVARRIAERVGRLVLLSSPHQTPHPFFRQPNAMAALHARIEGTIMATGVATTILRPGIFASNAEPWWAASIRNGDLVRWPYGAAETAPIDERDVAAVAAHVVCDDGHVGRDYVLTGSERLSHIAQVNTIGEALDRELTFEEISPKQFHEAMDGRYGPAVIDMLLDAWAATIGHPAFVTSAVADVTGAPARPFRQWVADHIGAFKPDAGPVTSSA